MITHFKGFVYGVDASAMFAQAISPKKSVGKPKLFFMFLDVKEES